MYIIAQKQCNVNRFEEKIRVSVTFCSRYGQINDKKLKIHPLPKTKALCKKKPQVLMQEAAYRFSYNSGIAVNPAEPLES